MDLFAFVEVTLIQNATVAGHFPGVAAASAKSKTQEGQQGGGFVALPQSAVLISQEWLTTMGFLLLDLCQTNGDGESEILVHAGHGNDPRRPSMKNGLSYLTQELFWRAMQAIANNTHLVSSHTWFELRDMIDEQVQKTHPQIYAVEEVVLTPIPPVQFTHLATSDNFKPNKARQKVIRLFETHHPPPNPNRWRLSGTTKSLTFGAQTGRGSDNGCVVNRTYEAKYARLIAVVHELAQAANGPALPYLGSQT